MQAIRQANRMKTFQLVAGETYRIPVEGAPEKPQAAQIPARRRPAVSPASRE